MRGGEQAALGAQAVDGVDQDAVEARDRFGRAGPGDEADDRPGVDARVDAPRALGEHLGFGAADRAVERVQLAVGVGGAHGVAVDQHQPADAAAREGLRGPRTDAAEAHHHEAGAAETLQPGLAVKSGDAGEALEGGGIHAMV